MGRGDRRNDKIIEDESTGEERRGAEKRRKTMRWNNMISIPEKAEDIYCNIFPY